MNKKILIPYSIIFTISGLIYTMLELAWRGRTHWTMFICAGLCGLVIANVNNNLLKFDTDFRVQYRNTWGTIHILGDQINILFFGIWIIISVFGLPFLDWLQWKLELAEKPYYRIGQKYFYPWEKKE